MSQLEWWGWIRRDGRFAWQRSCGPCATMAECSRALGTLAKERGIAARNCVITAGSTPRELAPRQTVPQAAEPEDGAE